MSRPATATPTLHLITTTSDKEYDFICEGMREGRKGLDLAATPIELRQDQPTFPDFEFDMPLNCLYGALGHVATTLLASLGPAYLSLLAAYSAKGINTNLGPAHRASIYAVLVAPVGAGKTQIMNRAIKAVNLRSGHIYTTVPSSDRGLLNMLAPEKVKDTHAPSSLGKVFDQGSILLHMDEMQAMLAKGSIQNSTLPQTLCSLWSQDNAGAADKQKSIEIQARISILGGIPVQDPSDFATIFGAATMGGLYARFLYAPCPDGWEPRFEWDDEWEEMNKPTLDDPVDCKIPKHIGAMVYQWAREHKSKGTVENRLVEHARRIAMIQGSANGDREVTKENMEAAMRLMDWQVEVRKAYAAGRALNQQGQLAEEILAALQGHHKKQGKRLVTFSSLLRKHNWSQKYGPQYVFGCLKSLIGLSQIYEQRGKDKDGKDTNPTGKYALPQYVPEEEIAADSARKEARSEITPKYKKEKEKTA